MPLLSSTKQKNMRSNYYKEAADTIQTYLKDERMVYVKNVCNQGVAESRNIGVLSALYAGITTDTIHIVLFLLFLSK